MLGIPGMAAPEPVLVRPDAESYWTHFLGDRSERCPEDHAIEAAEVGRVILVPVRTKFFLPRVVDSNTKASSSDSRRVGRPQLAENTLIFFARNESHESRNLLDRVIDLAAVASVDGYELLET